MDQALAEGNDSVEGKTTQPGQEKEGFSMKSTNLRIVLISFFLVFTNPVAATADFTGDFSPENWRYFETNTSAFGPRNSLDATTLLIHSADWGFYDAIIGTYGQYGIEIPWYLETIKFDYSYVTYDVDGSSYDMPSYTLNGTKTFLVANNIPKNGTASGSISLDVSSLAGKPLFFSQECSDCVLGPATIKITNFVAKSRSTLLNSNTLASSSNPVLTRDASGFTCSAPKFAFKRYGFSQESALPTSFVYTLIIDGKRVSTISSDNWKTLSRTNFASTTDALKGAAALSFAVWSANSQSFSNAQCEVVAFQDNATSLSFSNVLTG